MFFAELGQVLLRRWYLLLVGLLFAGAAGSATFQSVPPAFTATAEVLLLPPGPSVPEDGNPYLSLSGLSPAGDVLARALSDPKSADEVAAAGGRGQYTVALDGDSPAPLVFVSAEAETAKDALATRDLVLQRLPAMLRQIQAAANVPGSAYITTSEVTRADKPVKEIKPQLRALVMVVGGALVLTLLGTAAVDALLGRRHARRAVRPAGREPKAPRKATLDSEAPAAPTTATHSPGPDSPGADDAPEMARVTADHSR
jgi:hypothetical protein